MEQKPNDQKTKASIAIYLWLFPLTIGTSIGVALGAAIDNIGVGAALGIGIGVSVGLILYRRFNKNSSED